MVKNGGLATYGLDYFALGKLAGNMAVDIIENGTDVSTMPVQYISAEDCSLAVNSEAATDLGVSLDGVMDRARIWQSNSERTSGRRKTVWGLYWRFKAP